MAKKRMTKKEVEAEIRSILRSKDKLTARSHKVLDLILDDDKNLDRYDDALMRAFELMCTVEVMARKAVELGMPTRSLQRAIDAVEVAWLLAQVGQTPIAPVAEWPEVLGSE